MSLSSGTEICDPLPWSRVEFAHNSERQLAKLLDFFGVAWLYEPHTFTLRQDPQGRVREAFSPDFYLPDQDLYLEVTTARQELVTRKNRKVRRLRSLRPELEVRVLYQRDYLHLLWRYGLEAPSQLELSADCAVPAEAEGSLMELGPLQPWHPSNPWFHRAGSGHVLSQGSRLNVPSL